MPKAPSILILPEPYLEPILEVTTPNSTTLVNSPSSEAQANSTANKKQPNYTAEFTVEDEPEKEFIDLAYLQDYLSNNLKPVKSENGLKVFNSGRIRLFIDGSKTYVSKDSFKDFELDVYKEIVNKIYWFDVQVCTASDLKFINDVFKLNLQLYEVDGSSLKDNVKVQKHNKSSLVTLLSLDESQTSWLSLTCFKVSPKITFTFHSGAFEHSVLKIYQKLTALQPHIDMTSDWVVYGLYDQLQVELQVQIDRLALQADTMEESLLDENDSQRFQDPETFLKQLNLTKLKLNKVSFILHSLPNLNKSCKDELKRHKRDPKLYFGDIKGRLGRINTQVYHIETVLRRINYMYTDQLTLTTIQANNATFDTTMFFTYFGMATSILILVSGLWGTNVLVPGKAREPPEPSPDGQPEPAQDDLGPEGHDWFLALLGGSLCLAALIWIAFRYYSYRKLR